MYKEIESVLIRVGLVAPLLMTASAATPIPTAFAASTVYWCPDRKSDQRLSASPSPGCVPLVDDEEQATRDQEQSTTGDSEPRDFNIDNLQQDASEFLKRYRRFLDCCKTDLTELRQVKELGDEVGALLAATQAQISNHALVSRGVTIQKILTAVAKARSDLKVLRARLERIRALSTGTDGQDFEASGRQARLIREIQESIDRDFHAPEFPPSPKTGSDIGTAPAVGPGIGRTPKTGSVIGVEGRTGRDIGASPKSSQDIGGSGPTGFEIGATGRAGPAIGESSLNQDDSSNVGSTLQRSTVGSSLPDSTVGSSLGPSSVGSSLQDSTVGSSFGGSAVGSSLPSR
jgi:hypothetical protein